MSSYNFISCKAYYLPRGKINQLVSDQCFLDSISYVAYTTSEETAFVFLTCVIHLLA